MRSTVILIGPICAGKSTIAQLLAVKLDMPRYEVDKDRWRYYAEIGYDKAEGKRIAEAEGMLGLIQYWKPFEAYAVERALVEHPNTVMDFGAGHSYYEDATLFARVEKALEPFPNVILLLPSPDLDESVEILNLRFTELLTREVRSVDPKLLELNEQFVRQPSNHKLGKMVVYTKGKTPEETCGEIAEQLK
jgi:shikimate kinase